LRKVIERKVVPGGEGGREGEVWGVGLRDCYVRFWGGRRGVLCGWTRRRHPSFSYVRGGSEFREDRDQWWRRVTKGTKKSGEGREDC